MFFLSDERFLYEAFLVVSVSMLEKTAGKLISLVKHLNLMTSLISLRRLKAWIIPFVRRLRQTKMPNNLSPSLSLPPSSAFAFVFSTGVFSIYILGMYRPEKGVGQCFDGGIWYRWNDSYCLWLMRFIKFIEDSLAKTVFNDP